MIGLSILLVVAAYIWIARLIVKRFSHRVAKYGVITIFTLFPIWDVIPGWIYQFSLCQNDGGFKIVRRVNEVNGFQVRGLNADEIKKYLGPGRYDVIESLATNSSGKTIRYGLTPNGELSRTETDSKLTQYGYKSEWSNETLPFGIKKLNAIVFDTRTNEALGTKTQFASYGNWMQRSIAPLLGGGYVCPKYPYDLAQPDQFIIEILQPIKR